MSGIPPDAKMGAAALADRVLDWFRKFKNPNETVVRLQVGGRTVVVRDSAGGDPEAILRIALESLAGQQKSGSEIPEPPRPASPDPFDNQGL